MASSLGGFFYIFPLFKQYCFGVDKEGSDETCMHI
jgi:hypothetical protein